MIFAQNIQTNPSHQQAKKIATLIRFTLLDSIDPKHREKVQTQLLLKGPPKIQINTVEAEMVNTPNLGASINKPSFKERIEVPKLESGLNSSSGSLEVKRKKPTIRFSIEINELEAENTEVVAMRFNSENI